MDHGNSSAVADALVIFGITGDLAHKMTFRALYRLERRTVRRTRGGCLPAATGTTRHAAAQRPPRPWKDAGEPIGTTRS